ncbi:hypothetical protein SSX86_002352 [Deinandra increscens subsp. villosa]|uniref:Integrase catalytic domain-containing protein n=1 Tax=Deinandra increscens subsp. villosa TaxID=3103831 RepID=A0AAP0DNF8_9ASTR
MASSSSQNHNAAFFHALHIKLKPDNYLLWRNQILPILTFQNLLHHVDGSAVAPSPTVTTDGKPVPNPEFISWNSDDQQTVIIIHTSLTEEAVAIVVGLPTAREIWVALENAYNNTSTERVQLLKDSLRMIVRGDRSVAEYARDFKTVCDQLAAIGHPVDISEQNHHFVTNLGPDFLNFSMMTKALSPNAPFSDLLSKAQSYELLAKAVSNLNPKPSVAFAAQSTPASNPAPAPTAPANRRFNDNRHNRNNGNSRYKGNRNSDPCQWCGIHGHKAHKCRKLLQLVNASSKSEATSSSSNVASVDEEALAKAFTAQCNANNSDPDWYVDSGASDHMTGSKISIKNIVPKLGNKSVTFGNGEKLEITHKGDTLMANNLKLNDILIVPNIKKNLLSVSKLTKNNNVDVLFSHSKFYIQDRVTKQVLAEGQCEDGLYVLQNNNMNKAFVATTSCPKASFEDWHSRLGHVSFDSILLLQKSGVIGLTSILPKPGLCAPCQMAKAQKLPFNDNEKRAMNPLDLIHCDLWGPSPITSLNGYRYYAAFVDDFSRFCWLYPLKTKNEFANALQVFMTFAQTQFSRKIKIFQSDGGTEFINSKVREIFEANGTLHRTSCPYTPQQNGRVERKHRHIVETGLSMLFQSKLNPNLWVEAFSTAIFVINRLPSRILNNRSPFELLYNYKPEYASFKPFGCRVYPLLRPYSEHKLSPRSLPCIFLGYSAKHKGYKCLDPMASKIFITRHARFDEHSFPALCQNNESPQTNLPIANFLETLIPAAPKSVSPAQPNVSTPPKPTAHSPKPNPPSQQPDASPQPSASAPLKPNEPNLPCPICVNIPQPINSPPPADPPTPPSTPPSSPSSSSSSSAPSSLTSSPIPTPPPPPPLFSHHPMQTRAKSGIFKPKHQAHFANTSPLHHALLSTHDPKTHTSALKREEWKEAMVTELQALHKNNTWLLVPRPPNRNIVGSKWLFRTKYRSDGSIERRKARLVAQGYSQIPGLDFTHTFSPVVKAATIRIVLTLAVINSWPMHQLDVNNAFLHGNLDESIFMEQPPGFIDNKYPNHVCKLNKALYGLKQAPRAWFKRLSVFLKAKQQLHDGHLCLLSPQRVCHQGSWGC